MHAWRALGQLRAVEAVEPLLELFDRLGDDDWIHEELPAVFGMIGPAVLPALAAYIADLSHTDSSWISAISGLKKIGKRWPDARSECIGILEERLERFEENEPDVNGFLVMGLVELGAKEAAPVIERLLPSLSAEGTFPLISSQVAHKGKATHKKVKSNMAKLSRKKNRKR